MKVLLQVVCRASLLLAAGCVTCPLVAPALRIDSAPAEACDSPVAYAPGSPRPIVRANDDEPHFGAAAELSAETLVQAVLERNPSLAQMTAAWEAASARYPQVTSLDDPMFAVTLGPASYDSSTVQPAYRLELSQKYSLPIKRRLRGDNALAEAAAAGNDVEAMRLELAESARNAFYDYYLAARMLAINEENLRLLKGFKENAESRFKTGQAPQQDVLQVTVEIGREEQRRLAFERMRRVVVGRINTLLRLGPDAPLPPPRDLAPTAPLPDSKSLRGAALSQRPDIQALSNRLAAEHAALALAEKEYCPDVEPFIMYDRFMGNDRVTRDLALQAGVRLNLPVRHARRTGAIAEARAKIAQREAELARLTDQVALQVHEAYEQVQEYEKTIQLYDKTIRPAADANVKAAVTSYVTGKIPFLSLLEAQRNDAMIRERYYEAQASYHRQRAALERAVGGALAVRHEVE